jgi:glycosyltransferase involved in cell wall biosynthesis
MHPPRLLCLGRLAREKGFDVALEAFGALAPSPPAVRLVFASNGSARAGLEDQATRLGVLHRVDFLRGVPFEEIPGLLNASTLVLMPSRYPEGFGLVALEAALMARPVIAARAGALEEVVVDGETGVLVEREDWRAVADAITRLLARPDEARRLGEQARRSALARFGWAAHVDAFDDLYRRLGDVREPRRFEREPAHARRRP